MDLRCNSKRLGVLLENGDIELKCNSDRCGHAAGVTVLHTFNGQTGELLSTECYKNPPVPSRKETKQ